MSLFLTLDQANVTQKIVLLRVDLNVPVQNGCISDMTRIHRILPTLKVLTEKGARVVIMSHFGRPKGKRDEANSLAFLAPILEAEFVSDCVGHVVKEKIAAMAPAQVLLLENLRFYPGEETNDPEFAKSLAELGDVYVNDAFSCVHRAHASIEGITHYLPSYAGYSLMVEVEALEKSLHKAQHPLMAIVGGSKVSTKLDLLENLVAKVDCLVVGGGMANTFLGAQGYPIGHSLCEPELYTTALRTLQLAEQEGCEIILPLDVVVTEEIRLDGPYQIVDCPHVLPDQKIVDVGPKTLQMLQEKIKMMKTIVWNGPLGVFEVPPYHQGTLAVARMVADSQATTVAGGGDTVAALAQSGVSDKIGYISTAGGAFLEWLEGKRLPGIEALIRFACNFNAKAKP